MDGIFRFDDLSIRNRIIEEPNENFCGHWEETELEVTE
jgi:hypothetical protein